MSHSERKDPRNAGRKTTQRADREQADATPSATKGLWTRFLVLVPLAIALAVVSWIHIRAVRGSYEATGVLDVSGQDLGLEDVELSREGVVEVESVWVDDDGNAHVVFCALADGTTQASLASAPTHGGAPAQDEDGDTARDMWMLEVRDGGIVEGGINFSGWQAVYGSICVLLATAVLLFASALHRLGKSAWYGYEMVACGGGALFCLFQLTLFCYLMAGGGLDGFGSMISQLTSVSNWFVVTTLVPLGIFALLVSASNVSLIRHEGLRAVNLLGIATTVVWAGACELWLWAPQLIYDLVGPGSLTFINIADSLVSTAISFGECLLLSTILCAWLAARHIPRHGADYLVVLGCGIRADGTPSPLLAGRVDRALAFDASRAEAGDPPATFVPSGGQGADEVMSEAQSMANYLEAKGVDAGRIVLESRSATTRQNMAYSREVIEAHARDAASVRSAAPASADKDVRQAQATPPRVVFSTTNYHVFRGYVCAHEAGMAAEGIGAKTRAYFWPNAFLREFAGLLVAQWRSILYVYLVLALLYGVAAYLLTLT